jgi:S-methylmethionine-dependent homocysteine/selenocysteine methylase
MDMDDLETTWPITSLAPEPMLAEKQKKEKAMEEKTFRKIVKLKLEVVRRQRQQIGVALTAPAATTAPMTPPAKALASDSSVATARSSMSGQGSYSSAYSSETRRDLHKIKRELRELHRQQIDVASTAPAAVTAPMTPPAKALASDSSVATARSSMSGQGSYSSAYSSETRRDLQRIKRELRDLHRQRIDVASTAPAAAAAAVTAPMTPPAKALASDSSVAIARSSMSGQGSHSSAYLFETRREVHTIKRELRELLRLSTVTTILAPTTKTKVKKMKVRFTNPLVTQVNLRPWTLEADIEELYFCPEELNELEWDRETTEADQYECIAQEQSSRSSGNNVAIAHKLKRYGSTETGDDDMTVATDDQSFCSSETDIISNAATE